MERASLPWRTIPDLLSARAASHGASDLLRFEGRRATIAGIHDRSGRLAGVLRTRGVRRGDRVALLLPNGIEFPVAWLAVVRAGAVVVPVSTKLREADRLHILRDSGATLAVASPEHAPTLAADRGGCPALRDVMVFGPPGAPDGEPLERALASAPLIGAEPAEPDDVVTIQYTSGTTGLPKGCLLSHEYWLELGNRMWHAASWASDDVVLTAQPFYYMDPVWNLMLCLLAGVPLVVLPRFSASTFWRSVRDQNVTFFYCLGTMPTLLLKQPEDPAVDRGHRVRFVLCSGIPPGFHAAIESRWRCPWRETYGTTELGVVTLASLDDHAGVGTGDLGPVVPGKEIRIADMENVDVPDGSEGELLVRGRGLMKGYWSQPEETAAWGRSGWAHTGDLVRRDAGRLRLVGRLKDMIRRGGENVSAVEVETVLCEHPGVRAAACVAVPDELRGEEVKVFVQLVPEQTPATLPPPALLAHVRARLADFKVPRYLEYVDQLPLTPSQRVAKHELLARKADQRRGAWDASAEAWG
jgi:acyl-CoA synthetase (AMP-forming)/AMP-acid ligase II